MKKGLIQVFAANVIFLLAGIITNFILPRYLSVDSYSMVKTYALYISYAGFFHLGYSDGMYLKFGGRSVSDLKRKELASNFGNYCIVLAAVSIVILSVGIVFDEFILKAFAFGVFATNLIGYFKNFSQAIGEYKLYGNALNAEKVLALLFYLVLIFVMCTDNFEIILTAQVLSTFLVAIFLCIKVDSRIGFLRGWKFSANEIASNIKQGFVLMLGNFSSSLFTGLDRWFVKALMSSFYFAQYSFAVSMEQIINVFITPITVSMYNYFCNHKDIEDIKRVKRYSLIWAFAVVSVAFPLKWFVAIAIPKYIESTSVMFLLFATHIFYTIIKGIYVNYYKSNSMQSLYLKQLIIMTVIAFITNAVGYMIIPSMNSFAAATLLTAAIWLIACEIHMKPLRFSVKERIAIILVIVAYLVNGLFLEPISGFIGYVLVTLIVCRCLMNDSFTGMKFQLRSAIDEFKTKKCFGGNR